MPNSTSLDAIAQQLDALTPAELVKVQAMIAALLEAKASQQQNDSSQIKGVIAAPSRETRGHIEIKMIRDKKRGKTYGPYRYLRYWQDGKLQTRYLGKVEECSFPRTNEQG